MSLVSIQTGQIRGLLIRSILMLKPWKHQKSTIKKLSAIARGFDVSDPGCGKTRSALEIWAKRRKEGCALVLAPKSLLEAAWLSDINKFTPFAKPVVAYAHNREATFKQDADIYITNLDAVKWLAKQKPAFFKRFGTLIIDESTAFKHRTSQRSKAVRSIVKYFKYRELLTGTPNSNSITDIWHQILLLDDGERLGNNFFRFRDSVCTPVQVGPGANHIKWTDKPGAEDAVAYLLKDITVRNKFEDVMDIPANYTRTMQYKMSDKLRIIYEKLLAEAIVTLNNEVVTAVNAAVLRNKLLQCCSGAVYSSENKYVVIDHGRYELIADLIEEHAHSVTFFMWRHQKELIAKQLQKRSISYAIIDGSTPVSKRTKIVDDYQKGLFQTLLLHPQTGAHGLTLTKGTRTIFSSPIYQADFFKQAKHRTWRGGQTKKTETILVEASSTIEKSVYERLDEKTTRMISLLDILNE